MARLVGIGLLVGTGLTTVLGAALLGHACGNADRVAYAASLLCIVAAYACAALNPALRAGRIDPVRALKRD